MSTSNAYRLVEFALTITGADDDQAAKGEHADRVEFFRARDGKVFADVYEGALRLTWPVQSKFFSRWLARTYFETKGKIAPLGQLRAAVNLIEARTEGGVPEREVFVRVGEHAGRIYLDLADASWSAIEIDALGWRVVQSPPVRFLRTPAMLPVPVPEKGGSRRDAMSMKKHIVTGSIRFLDGIYLVEKSGAKKRIADPIQVTAFGTSEPGTMRELAYTAVRFVDREDKWKSEIVPSSMLVSQPGEFVALLAGRGYQWPPTRPLRHKIIGELSVVKPVRRIRVTPVPGCHGDSYVLPGESYTPKGPDREHFELCYNPTVRLGEFRRSGTLKKWKKRIAKACIHSSRARLAVATVFAAPNLQSLNINSFGINFSGPTSGGKTLCIRLAGSAPGLNSGDGPTTWDGSAAGFEQRALGHRDGVVLFDDMSHLDRPDLAKLVTFRLAGNRPKTKAGQYVSANNLVDLDWHVIALSTSESPIWQDMTKPGRGRVRGEEVRMINVRACVSDQGDIFDGPDADEQVGSTLEERLDFVEKLEKFTQDYQGEAFRTYLAKRFADKRAEARLKSYMTQFLDAAALPEQSRWLGRIRRFFAAVYASAAQAIDYGVLPWRKRATLKAILSCMTDAMNQLTASFPESPDGGAERIKSDGALVVEFKRRVKDAKFVRIERYGGKSHAMAKQLRKADGFVQITRPGRVRYLLRSTALETWFPDVTVRKHLGVVLRSRGILKAGRRSDTSTRQIYVAPLKKRVSCYAILRKRISK